MFMFAQLIIVPCCEICSCWGLVSLSDPWLSTGWVLALVQCVAPISLTPIWWPLAQHGHGLSWVLASGSGPLSIKQGRDSFHLHTWPTIITGHSFNVWRMLRGSKWKLKGLFINWRSHEMTYFIFKDNFSFHFGYFKVQSFKITTVILRHSAYLTVLQYVFWSWRNCFVGWSFNQHDKWWCC